MHFVLFSSQWGEVTIEGNVVGQKTQEEGKRPQAEARNLAYFQET